MSVVCSIALKYGIAFCNVVYCTVMWFQVVQCSQECGNIAYGKAVKLSVVWYSAAWNREALHRMVSSDVLDNVVGCQVLTCRSRWECSQRPKLALCYPGWWVAGQHTESRSLHRWLLTVYSPVQPAKHISMHVHTHTCAHARACTHTHTHTHTHKHAYADMKISVSFCLSSHPPPPLIFSLNT